MFPSDRAASAALTLYAKSSVVGCLENLFEKQVGQDPQLRDVHTTRSSPSSIARTSPVWATTASCTRATSRSTHDDGSSDQIGIGSAAVRVGRPIDLVTYTTTGPELTDVLTPGIDASVARLRTALVAKRHMIQHAARSRCSSARCSRGA